MVNLLPAANLPSCNKVAYFANVLPCCSPLQFQRRCCGDQAPLRFRCRHCRKLLTTALVLLFGHLAEPSGRLARIQTPFPWPRVSQNVARQALCAPAAGLSQAAAAPRCVLRATPAALSLGWLASESASSSELTSSFSSSPAKYFDSLPPRALLASSTP